jgi:hypothetical protein
MKTILSIFIFLSLMTMATAAATPETDAEFFHPAASLYIQGESAGASNLVEKGLSIYPDDGKLKRLKELLEQQQEQEQENQDEQNQDQQQNEDQENEDQENQDQQDTQDQQDQGQNEENQEQEPQQPEPQSSEQMSEDEAKQLLDAMKQEEETKRMQLHPVLGAPVKVDKDW